jgi:hypothetical protein
MIENTSYDFWPVYPIKQVKPKEEKISSEPFKSQKYGLRINNPKIITYC